MKRVVSIVALLLLVRPFSSQGFAQDIGLDTYTCAQFLSDTKNPSNGEKLLKSMMMIAWATGYAAGFQPNAPRADIVAIRLIAATLGSECQKAPDRRVVDAIKEEIKKLAGAAEPNMNGRKPSAPVATADDDFKIYDNYDLPKGDSRTLKGVDFSKCKAACKTDKQCQALSYDKWNKWCFIKSSVTQLASDPSFTSAVQKALDEPQRSTLPIRIQQLVNKSFRGTSYRNTTLQSAKDCQKICEEDQQCLGFTFGEHERQCRFFDDITTEMREGGTTSGYKTGSAP